MVMHERECSGRRAARAGCATVGVEVGEGGLGCSSASLPGAWLWMVLMALTGCVSADVEMMPRDDGGYRITTRGAVSASFEREGVKASVDSRKSSVFRDAMDYLLLRRAAVEATR